ncbi:hypothetical protein RDABS01_021172, partial [Bienertia sinuspersici]
MDSWAWKFTKDGCFAVRSAYFKELQRTKMSNIAGSSNSYSSVWKVLWGAKIKPKIKMFAWKALHGGLPVKQNLCRRGMEVDPLCPLCGAEAEMDVHFAMKCGEAKNLWYLSPLRIDTNEFNVSSIFNWVHCLQRRHMDENWWSLFWNLAWSLWMRRNEWVFEKKRVEITDLVQRVPALTMEYMAANEKIKNLGFNTDATVAKEDRVGCGAVVRDCFRDVLVSMCNIVQGRFEVDIMEEIAARQALEVALDAGLRNIILETDNFKFFNQLSKKKADSIAFVLLIQDILKLGSTCQSIKFSHVKRSGNKVAHELAKLSEGFGELRVWVEDFPHE